MSSYIIPAGPVEVEYTVKRSLFICRIQHTADRNAADSFISKIRTQYSDANHNCWAFIAGAPSDSVNWAMNDDGEPKGCAGKPMFNVLQHSNIGEICAVVTRYFGGIKLGTGGMARAYSAAVKMGLEELETTEKKFYQHISFDVPYELLKDVEHLISQFETVGIERQFDTSIRITADFLEGTVDSFEEKLQHITAGRVHLNP